MGILLQCSAILLRRKVKPVCVRACVRAYACIFLEAHLGGEDVSINLHYITWFYDKNRQDFNAIYAMYARRAMLSGFPERSGLHYNYVADKINSNNKITSLYQQNCGHCRVYAVFRVYWRRATR